MMTFEERRKVFIGSMADLCRDTRFQVFMENVRDMKDQAVRDMMKPEVLSNSTTLSAAAGEVRTYIDILDSYDDFLAQPLQNALDSVTD